MAIDLSRRPDFNAGGGENTARLPNPFVSNISPKKIVINTLTEIVLEGSYFTEDIKITTPSATISNIKFLSDNKVTFDILCDRITDLNFEIDNGRSILSPVTVQAIEANWLDLRDNELSFGVAGSNSNIEYKFGMGYVRQDEGIYFTGLNPWSSWIGVKALSFDRASRATSSDRDSGATIEIITGSLNDTFMLGVGSELTNVNSSAQYYEGELLFYLSGARFSGFYGRTTNQGYSINLPTYPSYKFKLSGGVQKGSQWFIYGINSNSIESWDDESNLLGSGTIRENFAFNGDRLYPMFIPRSSSSNLYIAARVI